MAASIPPAQYDPFPADPLPDDPEEDEVQIATGAPLWAVLLHDMLTRPTGFPAPARFAALMLIDGALVLLTLLLVVLAIPGPVSAAFLDRPSLMLFFSMAAVFTLCLTGLYWRCWRFLSFGDCIMLSTAVAGSMAAAWGLCLIVSAKIRAVPLDVIGFALLHSALLLVAMIGARTIRRGLREFARAHIVPRGERHNILLLGELDWIRSLLEMLRADRTNSFHVVGALTFDGRDTRLQVAGVPVLGAPDKLSQITEALAAKGLKPESLVIRGDTTMPRRAFSRLVKLADQCDLTVAHARDLQRTKEGEPRIEIKHFELADLLGRPEVSLQRNVVERLIRGRRILVTGAGGTIGGELVRQIATFKPSAIVLLDHCEFNLYSIEMQVRDLFPDILCHPELCSIRERGSLDDVFRRREPEIVFHAAALKHVPIVECNPCEGAHTNVLGTRNVADAVCAHGALAMVQVSTDKAVNPVGVMGATKRLGELYCQALDLIGQCDPESPRFMTVRFGNVLGSSGSLVPLFQQQMAAGKPLTVTHPDMKRYFMTVAEAVQLILQSSARAMEAKIDRGTIFVLDMGEPIRIVDIARRMIRLAGLRPDIDVPIQFVGLRPGEKLYEELFDTTEEQLRSSIPGVIEASPCPVPLEKLVKAFADLSHLIAERDEEGVQDLMKELLRAPAQSTWARTLRELTREIDLVGKAANE
ncbi:polysaccharide biosynthesis protein [Sphingobium cloacae]|uniref:Nucleotide sugar epimerase n=1 Tax=Sphingobium cloacae TaxID=120107 RepID=A0A1E1F5D6_9SPHN|nr:nucleoside-diphosphate sugar epimerase/dehydratase [Sphingobium cloacae]BAV65641.1 nucleotide sugar epimerase [Sphingobium cloacae]